MRAFVDTNVVIYALLPDDPRKQQVAQDLLHRHSRDRSLWLSTQVLMEAYSVLTRKARMAPGDALAAVQLLATRQVVPTTAEGTLRALALSSRYQLSAWDAAIVQSALDAGCDTLYTEDLQNGQRFAGLTVVNPFELAVQALAVQELSVHDLAVPKRAGAAPRHSPAPSEAATMASHPAKTKKRPPR